MSRPVIGVSDLSCVVPSFHHRQEPFTPPVAAGDGAFTLFHYLTDTACRRYSRVMERIAKGYWSIDRGGEGRSCHWFFWHSCAEWSPGVGIAVTDGFLAGTKGDGGSSRHVRDMKRSTGGEA
jgi:hypothetical protein